MASKITEGRPLLFEQKFVCFVISTRFSKIENQIHLKLEYIFGFTEFFTYTWWISSPLVLWFYKAAKWNILILIIITRIFSFSKNRALDRLGISKFNSVKFFAYTWWNCFHWSIGLFITRLQSTISLFWLWFFSRSQTIFNKTTFNKSD